MDDLQPDPPPTMAVDPALLSAAKGAVCEVYEAVQDDLSVRSPVRLAAVAVANAMADLRQIREGLIHRDRGHGDPVMLRAELVGVAAYLVRAVVQLNLPAPISDPVDAPAAAATPPSGPARRPPSPAAVALCTCVTLSGVLLVAMAVGPNWGLADHDLLLAVVGWGGLSALALVCYVVLAMSARRGHP